MGEEGARHVLEHDKVSFVSEDQDEGVTRIEALCESLLFPLRARPKLMGQTLCLVEDGGSSFCGRASVSSPTSTP